MSTRNPKTTRHQRAADVAVRTNGAKSDDSGECYARTAQEAGENSRWRAFAHRDVCCHIPSNLRGACAILRGRIQTVASDPAEAAIP